ncbi:MAG: MBL fold metallo-hydrolase [Methanomassiliicoccales archaeon]|jgi:glyoxylase-like metal-dependent hydrolase (beta-lactamase superfamily II)
MTSLTVKQLCVGWLVRESGIVLEAHSTSSIILGGRQVIVVDTSDRSLRPKVMETLGELGLRVEDVDIVVNTHLHSDHSANNDLFPNAKVLSHEAEGRRGDAPDIGGGIELEEGVRVVHTPGHTPGSVSVFIDGERRTVIAGDAIPTRDNYVKMVPPGLNYDPVLAMRSMEMIVGWAEVIVPGHGPAFEVVH